jgi:hypothetical protein
MPKERRFTLWSSYHQHVAPIDLDYDVVTSNCPLEARGR